MDTKHLSNTVVDTLVGTALKAMVESGVDATRIGSFAAQYRAQVTQILQLTQPPQEPDLLAIVTQAVKTAMATEAPHRQDAGKLNMNKQRIYISVRGRRTSVCIAPQVIERVRAELPNRNMRSLIEAVAQDVPDGVENRSDWISQRLMSMNFIDQEATRMHSSH